MIFTVDKNLFLYDLAVVAILKNEGPYLKEWLDYHLAAGVDHFYLYDNESPDNQREVVEPYIAAGLVDYISAPGQVMQMVVYNDAVNRFKFQCRFMAFIDLDEFIFPKTNQSIVELVDEILSPIPDAAGVAINWQLFGSNGHDKADYSRGVLERFTRRAPSDWTNLDEDDNNREGNIIVKTIADPRKINFINNPHCPNYFEGKFAVNEQSRIVPRYFNRPVTVEKIAVNHYQLKSVEEYKIKMIRGRADIQQNTYSHEEFKFLDHNEVFDDGILKYRNARADNFSLEDDKHRVNRVINALIKTLNAYAENAPPVEKLETALTCRAVSLYLREKFPDIERMKLYEEVSLTAIKSSLDALQLWEARLLVNELPNFLSLPHPAVKDIRKAAQELIPQLISVFHSKGMWREFIELNYLQRLLKTWH